MDHHAVREVIPKTLIPYDLPWQDRHGEIPSPRNSYGDLLYPRIWFPPIPLGVPDLDWSVSIPGWRLVIEGGAIRGIMEE